MKRCPQCSREYDNTMSFCLDDGAELLYGPAAPTGREGSRREKAERVIEPVTAILGSSSPASEAPTRSKVPSVSTAPESKRIEGTARKKRLFTNKLAMGLGSIVVVSLVLAAAFFGYRFSATKDPTQIKSVAVMPFINDSGKPENEYLSDGMTETLINALAQIPGLSVKGRSSVFRYKGTEFHPPTIGKELHVEAILTGRLVQRGEQLTLSIELTDVVTENILWGNRYESMRSDLVKFQSDVGRDVSRHLSSGLSRSDEAKVTKSYTTDPKAFELYLQGLYFTNKRTPDSLDKAVGAFDQAIELDPNYALAYAGLSDAYSYQLPIDEAPKWVEYARKALEIDDSVASAHTSIANFKFFYERDYTGARREFERALELDPRDSVTCWKYSQFLAILGNSEEAIAMGRRAKELAPLDGSSGLAQAFVLSGRYDEALEETRVTLELDEKYFWSYYFGGIAYSEKGLHDEAIKSLERSAETSGSLDMKGALAAALARSGRTKDAQRVVDELILASKTKAVSQTSIAIGLVALGDKESAFDRLYRAVETRDEDILYLKTHPMFAPLRDDPRYHELLTKLKLTG